MRFNTGRFVTMLGALYVASFAVACNGDDGWDNTPGGDATSGTGGTNGAGGKKSGSSGGPATSGGKAAGGMTGTSSEAGAAGAGGADEVAATRCTTDKQCDPGICESHQCVDAECTSEKPCSGDDVCTKGRCVPAVCEPEVEFVYTPTGAAPFAVHLAGSFNNWDPDIEPLTKQDNGDWTVTVSALEADHSYEYKFVVFASEGADPKWVTDPMNARRVDDHTGGQNAVLLTNCTGAVPSCWGENQCTDQICTQHSCVDAECSMKADCAGGSDCYHGRCSATCVPAVDLVYTPPQGGTQPAVVYVAGLGDWNARIPLTKQDNGDWTVTLTTLGDGSTAYTDGQSYDYKFVLVDALGAETWVTDPNNLRRNGDNSAALVACDGLVMPECMGDDDCTNQICNDYKCVAPECVSKNDCASAPFCVGGRCSDTNCDSPHTAFTYTPPNGAVTTAVHLAGSFNGWDPGSLALTKQDNGDWSVSLSSLQAGQSYPYKFVVDDNNGNHWETDTNNLRKNGDGNSVALIDCDGLVLPECVNQDGCSGDLTCHDFACVATCDHTFSYTGDGTTTKVEVAGSFNGWSKSPLVNTAATYDWQAAIALPEGSYEYKLIINDVWMPDPNLTLNHSCAGGP